jgi:hypothetical protein
MKIAYSSYSQTYRIMPQNYWLCSVKNNRLVFDSWDGMTKNILKRNPFLYIRVIIIHYFKQ